MCPEGHRCLLFWLSGCLPVRFVISARLSGGWLRTVESAAGSFGTADAAPPPFSGSCQGCTPTRAVAGEPGWPRSHGTTDASSGGRYIEMNASSSQSREANGPGSDRQGLSLDLGASQGDEDTCARIIPAPYEGFQLYSDGWSRITGLNVKSVYKRKWVP